MTRWTWSALFVAVLAAIASAGPPPPPPPPNPEIVYVERGTTTKIVVMNSDGSNKTVVYSQNAFLTEPVWSPDGSAIAYTVSGVGLYRVMRTTGVTTLLLTNAQCGQSCWNPRFSPSGTRIAVIDGGLNAPRVLSVPSTGGPTQILYTGTPGTPLYDVAWRSDETQIAVVETVGGGLPDRIRVVDLQTSTATTVLEGPFDRINYIDWARNGVDRIAFDVGDTDRAIYRMDLGVAPVLVTSGAHPGFSPDNVSIVYRRLASRRSFIARLNLGTGTSTDLASGVEPDWKR